MKVDVKIIASGVSERSMDISGGTYEDLLFELDINPETVVVIKEGHPVPIDCKVSSGKITIIRVASGG